MLRETKSEQILALYDGARTTGEIAEMVGCRPEYVRVVARQRKGTGKSAADCRYHASPLGRLTKQRANEHQKPYHLAYMKVVQRTGDKALANAEARATYRKARKSGLSVREANRLCKIARGVVMIKTCNKKAARRAGNAAMAAARALAEGANKQIF